LSYNEQMTSQNAPANAKLLFKALAAREAYLDEPIPNIRITDVAVQIGLEGDEFDLALDYAAGRAIEHSSPTARLAGRHNTKLDFNKLFYLAINSHQLRRLAPAAIEQRICSHNTRCRGRLWLSHNMRKRLQCLDGTIRANAKGHDENASLEGAITWCPFALHGTEMPVQQQAVPHCRSWWQTSRCHWTTCWPSPG